MERELYVKMSPEEYESFKQCSTLEKQPPETLAAALWTAIQNNGGIIEDNYEIYTRSRIRSASLAGPKYNIKLTIQDN